MKQARWNMVASYRVGDDKVVFVEKTMIALDDIAAKVKFAKHLRARFGKSNDLNIIGIKVVKRVARKSRKRKLNGSCTRAKAVRSNGTKTVAVQTISTLKKQVNELLEHSSELRSKSHDLLKSVSSFEKQYSILLS